jgi:hypothetical protein
MKKLVNQIQRHRLMVYKVGAGKSEILGGKKEKNKPGK